MSAERVSPAAAIAPRELTSDPFGASRRERVAVLGGLAAVVVASLAAGLLLAPNATLELLGLIPVSVFAAGKFLPLWGITGESHFSPWQLGWVIWALDTVSVIALVYALEAVYRFDRLHRALVRVQENSRLVLRAYPGIRRAALTGLVLFVLFPVAGTGAVGGTFLGILLGVHRRTLIGAVSLGGLLGGMLMAFLAVNFQAGLIRLQHVDQTPTAKYLGLAVVGLLLVAGVAWMNRAYQQALARAQDPPDAR